MKKKYIIELELKIHITCVQGVNKDNLVFLYVSNNALTMVWWKLIFFFEIHDKNSTLIKSKYICLWNFPLET